MLFLIYSINMISNVCFWSWKAKPNLYSWGVGTFFSWYIIIFIYYSYASVNILLNIVMSFIHDGLPKCNLLNLERPECSSLVMHLFHWTQEIHQAETLTLSIKTFSPAEMIRHNCFKWNQLCLWCLMSINRPINYVNGQTKLN